MTNDSNITAQQKKATEKERNRRQFILGGNLWSVILKISLPLIVINALTFLYSIVDSMLAAQINKESISAVVVVTQICQMLSALGGGLASGGMIIIARLIGRNDYPQAKTVANTLIMMAVLICAVSIGLIVPLAAPILRLFRTPESTIAVGTKYFVVQIITAGISVFNNIYLGLEKARGQTGNILFLNFGVMIVKIALSVLFVLGLDGDITMMAVATLIANLSLSLFIVVRLSMRNYVFRFSFKDKNFSKQFLRPIILLSFPIFLGRFVFSLGKVIMNAMCGHYGDRVVGALGVSNNMGGYVTNVVGSVEESAGQIISTNLGNGNRDRAIKAFYFSFLLNVSIAALGVLILTIFNNAIVNFYATSDGILDTDYAQMISKIFFFEKMGIIALAVNSSVLSLLYGFGFTKISMYINLSRLFVFRIPSLWILMSFTSLGSESVGIAMLISNAGIGLMSVFVGLFYLKRIKKRGITDRLSLQGDKNYNATEENIQKNEENQITTDENTQEKNKKQDKKD